MRISGIHPSQMQKGEGKPDIKDVKAALQLNSEIEGLGAAQSVARSAEGMLGASSGAATPTIQNFYSYVKSLLAYLQGPPNNVPAALLQPIINQVSSIDPNSPNAVEMLDQAMQQLCAIGTAIDPNFVQKVEGTFAAGAAQANSDLKSLQAKFQSLESVMGGGKKYFQDLLNIMQFFLQFPSSATDGNLQKLGTTFQDLLAGLRDATWAPAINAVFNTLNNTPGITDMLGTLLFMPAFQQSVRAVPFPQAESILHNSLQSLTQQLISAGSPLLTGIANKINWWAANCNSKEGMIYLNQCDSSSPFPGSNSSYALKANWQAILATHLRSIIPSSAVGDLKQNLLAALNNTMPNFPNNPPTMQLALPFIMLTQCQTMFSDVQNGDLKDAFPFGPPQTAGESPESLNSALSSAVRALIQLVWDDMKHSGSNPALTSIMQQLMSQALGPPFSSTIEATLQSMVGEINALVPITEAQKEKFIDPAFTNLQTLLAQLEQQQAKEQQEAQASKAVANDPAMQDINKLMQKNFADFTDADWKELGNDLYDLIEKFAKTPDPMGSLYFHAIMGLAQVIPHQEGSTANPEAELMDLVYYSVGEHRFAKLYKSKKVTGEEGTYLFAEGKYCLKHGGPKGSLKSVEAYLGATMGAANDRMRATWAQTFWDFHYQLSGTYNEQAQITGEQSSEVSNQLALLKSIFSQIE